MEIVPLGPGFAAELRGVTLAEIAADTAAYKETRAALEEHSVIVFRGQDVTDGAQIAFSRQDRIRPRESGGARGAAAAMLAHGVEEPGERPQRSLHRLARLCDRGYGAGRSAKAARRADGCRDRAGAHLRARLA